MAGYLIARVNVTDPEKYKDYIAVTPGLIAKYGGREERPASMAGFDPSGDRIVSAGCAGEVQIWSEGAEIISWPAHADAGRGLVLAAFAGRDSVITASRDGLEVVASLSLFDQLLHRPKLSGWVHPAAVVAP